MPWVMRRGLYIDTHIHPSTCQKHMWIWTGHQFPFDMMTLRWYFSLNWYSGELPSSGGLIWFDSPKKPGLSALDPCLVGLNPCMVGFSWCGSVRGWSCGIQPSCIIQMLLIIMASILVLYSSRTITYFWKLLYSKYILYSPRCITV